MLFMYNYKNLLYIISALAASEKAMQYANKFTNSMDFFETDNQLHFNATITLLITIGEEIKKTDNKILQTEPSIKWKNITDMRNVLAHDYRGVDPDIVFNVIKIELPKLKYVLIKLLHLFSKNELEEVLNTKHYKHLQKYIQ